MLQGNPVQRKGQTHNKTKIQWKWKLLMSNSSRPCGPCSTWNSPGQNTGVGSCSLFKRIFPTQRWNPPGLPRCGWILYWLSHQGSPNRKYKLNGKIFESHTFQIRNTQKDYARNSQNQQEEKKQSNINVQDFSFSFIEVSLLFNIVLVFTV